MTSDPHVAGSLDTWDTEARQDMEGRGDASYSGSTMLSMHKNPVGPGGGGAACAKQGTQREENMKN